MKLISIILLVSLLLACATLQGQRAPRPREEPLTGRAQTEFRSGRDALNRNLPGRAIDNFKNVLELVPSHVESMFLIAGILIDKVEMDKLEESLEYLREAYDYLLRTQITIRNIPNPDLFMTRNRDTFTVILEKAEHNKSSIFQMLFIIGHSFYEQERFEEAIEIFYELKQLDPTRIEPLNALATVSRAMGDTEKAIEYMLLLFEQNPENTQILINLAFEFKEVEDFTRAIHYYKMFIDTDPTEISGYLAIADIYRNQKDYNNTYLYLQQAIEVNPTNTEVLADIIGIAQHIRKFTSAVVYGIKLYELEPTEENLRFLCVDLVRTEDWRQLINYARIWHEMNPENPDAIAFIMMGANRTNNQVLFREFHEKSLRLQ